MQLDAAVRFLRPERVPEAWQLVLLRSPVSLAWREPHP